MDSGMSTAAYVHRAGGSSSGSSVCASSSSSSSTTTSVGPPATMSSSVSTNGNANGSALAPPSTGAVAGGAGGGGRMAVIGVTRNVKLRRRGAAGFGFSLRGGREYAAGFYVSDVVPGGEAHRNGLRVGDQILRVNGYPVEDAVHQEVALLAKNQQVLVLKIRSVGMIPVKDNPNDPVTWHMVQQQQQQLQFGDAVSNEIRIRVLLGEKGRLGCGVCRGLVPGLTVQGTREGGPARAAGLKAGDIILWCNGVSLTDLPFERAIEVMRSSAILDLVVNRPIVNHVYDCPESLWMRGSSGYDSETSSLVGPSPPPPASQQQQAAMTLHRHHPGSPQHHHRSSSDPRFGQLLPCNRNARNCCPPNGSGPSDWGHVEQSQDWTRKQNNTTVIRISQSQPGGYNAQHYATQRRRASSGGMRPPPAPMSRSLYDDSHDADEEPLYDPVAPRDFECHDFDANPREELDRRAEYRREHGIRDLACTEQAIDDVFVKENGQSELGGSVVLGNSQGTILRQQPQQAQQPNNQQQITPSAQADKERKTVTTVEVHQTCPPAPPSMPPPLPYKWPTETKPMNAMGMQMGSTMSMGSTGSTETESSLESSSSLCGGVGGGKDTASTSSSLSTSSSCEPGAANAIAFATSIATAAACGASSRSPAQEPTPRQPTATIRPTGAGGAKVPPPPPPIDLSTAITQELQRRAKQRSMNNGNAQDPTQSSDKSGGINGQDNRKPQNPEALRAQEQKVTHDKLMEEFKRAHQRMFSNAQQRNQATEQQQQNTEQSEAKLTNSPTRPQVGSKNASAKAVNGDEAVEMQSIESFKLKDSSSVQVPPKPPSTYFSAANKMAANGCPPQNGGQASKPSIPCVGKPVSKVAIRIGTYEAESKQPSRLGFLRERSDGKTANESPVVSRLQNELVATLQRSNLRKKTEGENDGLNPTEDSKSSVQENGQIDKLASGISNKVTIRVNPEASSR